MLQNQYCEPCHRFLRGDVSLVRVEGSFREFEHHGTFESFEAALQLPCAICALAWTHVKTSIEEHLPMEHDWKPLLGQYHVPLDNEDMHELQFCDESCNKYRSSTLYFARWEQSYKTAGELLPSTQAEKSIEFLVRQYQDCKENHAECCNFKRESSTIYPSRLLRIDGDDGDMIRICETTTSWKSAWACLSHCWGKVTPLKLSAQTLTSLQEGIPVESLPKTFADAVFITRSLGLQYLWIDSLCIFQDRKDDWETESSRMGDIYTQAECTIAATASEDSAGGLFFNRDPITRPLSVDAQILPPVGSEDRPLKGTYLCDIQHLAEKCIEQAPLNSRAWVCQERQLSCRVLHFAQPEIFWECHKYMTCETYPEGLPKSAQSSYPYDATILKRRIHKEKNKHDKVSSPSTTPVTTMNIDMYNDWCVFLHQYSQCSLTLDTDRLIAIQGIANKLGTVLDGDQMVAGLWLSRLAEGLCWGESSRKHSLKPTQWIAPTWSWASYGTEILCSLVTRDHGHHPNHEFEAKIVSLKGLSRPSGRMERPCLLQIQCKLLPAIYTPDIMTENDWPSAYDPYHELGFVHGSLVILQEDRCILDCRTYDDHDRVQMKLDTHREIQGRQFGCMLVVHHCRHGKSHDLSIEWDEIDMLEALFLTLPNEEGHFERLGLVRAWGKAVNKVLAAHALAEDNIITLI